MGWSYGRISNSKSTLKSGLIYLQYETDVRTGRFLAHSVSTHQKSQHFDCRKPCDTRIPIRFTISGYDFKTNVGDLFASGVTIFSPFPRRVLKKQQTRCLKKKGRKKEDVLSHDTTLRTYYCMFTGICYIQNSFIVSGSKRKLIFNLISLATMRFRVYTRLNKSTRCRPLVTGGGWWGGG